MNHRDASVTKESNWTEKQATDLEESQGHFNKNQAGVLANTR